MNQEEDEDHDGGVLFYVNKGSFPLDDFTWNRMWKHVSKIYTTKDDSLSKLKEQEPVEIAVPQAPLSFPLSLTLGDRIFRIQKYMNELNYNHTGTQFFDIKKSRPLSGLMESAKEMIKESLPIKCLEAVILGIFLTNNMTNLERFPLSFKSVFQGHVHSHVVLGLYTAGTWGAIGMSRRDSLAYKPLEYKTLHDLVTDYKDSYSKYLHQVKKFKFGAPVPHDPLSHETIIWKVATVAGNLSSADTIREVEKAVKDIKLRIKYQSKRSLGAPTPAKDMAAYLARDSKPDRSTRTDTTAGVVRMSRDLSSQEKPGSDTPSYQVRV